MGLDPTRTLRPDPHRSDARLFLLLSGPTARSPLPHRSRQICTPHSSGQTSSGGDGLSVRFGLHRGKGCLPLPSYRSNFGEDLARLRQFFLVQRMFPPPISQLSSKPFLNTMCTEVDSRDFSEAGFLRRQCAGGGVEFRDSQADPRPVGVHRKINVHDSDLHVFFKLALFSRVPRRWQPSHKRVVVVGLSIPPHSPSLKLNRWPQSRQWRPGPR